MPRPRRVHALGRGAADAEHEAIVERETFERANALLDGHAGDRGPAGRNPAYILRGLLRCACCGSSFTPASTRKRDVEYRYYRCVTRDKQGREACPSAPLPAEIAKLSSEGKRLVDTIGDLKESARRLVERRLQEIGDQVARAETRLAEVVRETAALDAAEVEAGWVAQVLADFTSVWDVLTPENRGRLVRAVVSASRANAYRRSSICAVAGSGPGTHPHI